MRGSKPVLCLLPLLAFVMLSMSAAMGVALAQNGAPGPVDTPEALALEVIKGMSTERVVIGSGSPIAAAGDPAADGPGDLYRQIEVFKGGDVVVLTVPRGGERMPVAARVDSVKRSHAGPTNLLPFRVPAAGAAARGGPTNLVPLQPRAAGATFRKGPTNLIRFQPRAADAALMDGPTGHLPSPSPLAGATLRDGGDGIVVESVEQESPAWRDGLRQADVIAAANRARVGDVAALETVLASADPTVVLQVRRSGDEVIVVLHR